MEDRRMVSQDQFEGRNRLCDERKTYRPDPDATVKSQKGICWDFAVLAKVMLESQGIKCRVVIGHSDNEYHAWNDVWLDGEWVRYDMTAMVIGRPRITYKAERFA